MTKPTINNYSQWNRIKSPQELLPFLCIYYFVIHTTIWPNLQVTTDNRIELNHQTNFCHFSVSTILLSIQLTVWPNLLQVTNYSQWNRIKSPDELLPFLWIYYFVVHTTVWPNLLQVTNYSQWKWIKSPHELLPSPYMQRFVCAVTVYPTAQTTCVSRRNVINCASSTVRYQSPTRLSNGMRRYTRPKHDLRFTGGGIKNAGFTMTSAQLAKFKLCSAYHPHHH